MRVVPGSGKASMHTNEISIHLFWIIIQQCLLVICVLWTAALGHIHRMQSRMAHPAGVSHLLATEGGLSVTIVSLFQDLQLLSQPCPYPQGVARSRERKKRKPSWGYGLLVHHLQRPKCREPTPRALLPGDISPLGDHSKG